MTYLVSDGYCEEVFTQLERYGSFTLIVKSTYHLWALSPINNWTIIPRQNHTNRGYAGLPSCGIKELEGENHEKEVAKCIPYP